MTRLWVASDSTNQPERNSVAWALKTQIMIAKVAKSKIELIGPKKVMKRRMKRGVPVRGALELLLVDVVGRDRHLAAVVEQVVEQDLRRQHRQEAQEQRRGAGAEHVPEVRRRAHQHVLDRVGEDAPALDDAVGEDVEVLVEQDDVGGVLGDVGRGLDGDADVGVVQRDGVVDAVAEEADVAPSARWALMIRDFCSGVDAREDRRLRQRGGELARRRGGRAAAPVSVPATVEADVGADLLRDAVVVAGDDLDLDVEAPEAVERLARVGLGPVDEREEAGERRGRARRRRSGVVRPSRGARGDGDHAAAGGELRVEHRLRLRGDARAACEHRSRARP